MLTASDGGDGHPRQHATFPEKYARFVYAPKADYLHPHVLSEGVVHLSVNGVAMIDAGHAAHVLPGRMLQHRPPPGTCP